MEHVQHILHVFEKASRQKINLTKLSLFFSSKTPTTQKIEIGNQLGMHTVESMET